MDRDRFMTPEEAKAWGHIDDIVGFALRHDILTHAAEDRDATPLHELVRQMHVVPETLPVTESLERAAQRLAEARGDVPAPTATASEKRLAQANRRIDEYGGTSGVITMEDAVESLLGVEITDESDLVADLRQLAQQRAERQRLIQTITGAPAPASQDGHGAEPVPVPTSPRSDHMVRDDEEDEDASADAAAHEPATLAHAHGQEAD